MRALMNGGSVQLPGSYRRPWDGYSENGIVDRQQVIDATIWLRPRASASIAFDAVAKFGASALKDRTYRTRSELKAATGAHPDDIGLVRRHCIRHHLSVIEERWRAVVIRGTIGAFCSAFDATVKRYTDGARQFRQRVGWLSVPRELVSVVHGIFGASEWPPIHSMPTYSPPFSPRALDRAFVAGDTERYYQFPPQSDGSGETIGIVQFGGTFRPTDFAAAMPANGAATPLVLVHPIDGAARSHHLESEFDAELALDTQIAGTLAPGAELVLYPTPHSERGILDAIAGAIFDDAHEPSVFSISYGWPEPLWTPAALELFDELFAAAALVGLSVFCASGDRGSYEIDGLPHVLAPASSRFALACGGTTISVDPDALDREAAWEQTGGGFSEYPAPPWQNVAVEEADRLDVHPGRGVPDVAAQAHPGYRVIRDGAPVPIGGTSAVAPLWAALTARWNQRLRRRAGFFAPRLYDGGGDGLNPIESGANDRYAAHRGWNPATGYGTPNGAELEKALAG